MRGWEDEGVGGWGVHTCPYLGSITNVFIVCWWNGVVKLMTQLHSQCYIHVAKSFDDISTRSGYINHTR